VTRADPPVDAPVAEDSGSVGGYPRGRVPFDMRQRQILSVARTLFASNGYEATGIVDIARAAGVTRPVVYKHFESKEAIYLAVVRLARGELMGELESAVAGDGEPADRVRAATDVYFRYVERNQHAWEILFGGGAAVAGPAAVEAARLRADTIGFMARQIRLAAPNAPEELCDAFAHGLSGSAEQIAKWWRRHPHVPRATVVDYQLRCTWPGLAALIEQSAAGPVW
jgi:AcrR family transcriptional regulator